MISFTKYNSLALDIETEKPRYETHQGKIFKNF